MHRQMYHMYEPGPNKVSAFAFAENMCSICASLVSSRTHSLHQIAFAAFSCLETKARCETRNKFTRQICTTHSLPRPCVIMAFRQLNRTRTGPIQDNSETIPGPEQYRTVQNNTFQDHSRTIPGPFQEHSRTVPGPEQDHSRTIPGSFQDHSRTIPAPEQYRTAQNNTFQYHF